MATEFEKFVRQACSLKLGAQVQVSEMVASRRNAISTLQIALRRKFVSRKVNGRTILWRLK